MKHSLDDNLVEKATRKTAWDIADELEEEAKEALLEEITDPTMHHGHKIQQ